MASLFTLATDTPYVIIGSKRIARVMGMDRSTVLRLIRDHQLPVCRMPSQGRCKLERYATTYGLIDAWITGRWRASLATAADTQITGVTETDSGTSEG